MKQYLSKYMNMVKKKEYYRLANMFQFFLLFYGILLIIISIYYWMLTYKISERIILFSTIGIMLAMSGFLWNKTMKKTKEYKEITDKNRFYSPIME